MSRLINLVCVVAAVAVTVVSGVTNATAQSVNLLAASPDGAYELYSTPTGDVFLNSAFLGNSTSTRWSWKWSRTVQSPTIFYTWYWSQVTDWFNAGSINAAPLYGSYTSTLIGSYPHVFVIPVSRLQYVYYHYEYGTYSYSSTWYDAGGRLTPRFTDALDAQQYGQLYMVLDADTGTFVDLFTMAFASHLKGAHQDLNYFYNIQSQAYTFTPAVPVAGRTPAPAAGTIAVVNNPAGTNDTVTVSNLQPGDVVRVYRGASGAALLGTGTVATGDSAALIEIEQLGVTAGDVYASVTRAGMLESARTACAYPAEQTNRPPVANAGPDSVVAATSAAGATVALNGTLSFDADNDPITWIWTGSFGTATGPTPNVSLPLGANTVTLTVSDGKLTSTDTVVITVADLTPPVLTLPTNLIVEATSPAGAPVSFTASATDDVSGAVPVTCTPASGSTFGLGTTVVTATASDAAGNVASGTFTVTVVDTTPPVIAAPADITVPSTSATGAVVTFAATANDLVSGNVPVSPSTPSGSTFPIGVTTVTLTATDAAGNTATASFTVTVLSPSQQVDSLLTMIESLPGLTQNEIGALTMKLDAASASLARGNTNSAAGQLSALVNQLQALINSGRLSASDGNPVIAYTQNTVQQLR